MRLITWKIHRAFPELDPYDDEQCRRFIRAARSSPLVASLHAAAMFLTMAPLLLGGIAGVLYLSDRYKALDFSLASLLTPTGLFFLAACLGLVSIGPLAAYLVRDRLLRRRLAFVLRTRGACPTCAYSLIGLPLSRNNSVLCPECGVEVEVDASLGELSREGTGRVLVAGVAQDAYRFWTPERLKLLKRTALAAAVLLVALLPAAGLYELGARSRAAAALSSANALAAKLNALTTAEPPADAERSPWVLFGRAAELVGAVDTRENEAAAYRGPPVSFEALFRPDPAARAPWAGLGARHDAEVGAAARARLAAYNRAGLPELHRRLAALDALNLPAVRDVPGAPIASATGPGPASNNLLAHAMIANAQLCEAARNHDNPAFLAALDAALALARLAESTRLYNHAVLGAEIETITYANLRWHLASADAPPSILPDIAAALARNQTPIDIPGLYETWRLEQEHFIARVFSSRDVARWGSRSALFAFLARSPGGAFYDPGASLGSLDANLRAVEDLFRAAAPDASKEPSARTGFSPAASFAGLALVTPLRVQLTSAADPFDRLLFERRGIAILVALERFHADRGRDAASLDELVPAYLPVQPDDPWAKQPFRYRVLSPAPDPHRRRFLLYSVGPNLRDDGGEGVRARAAFSQGADLVVNDPIR